MAYSDLNQAAVALLTIGHCPDCKHRGFVLGPRGGLSINLECGGCGNRFNAAYHPWLRHVVMAHRLPSKADGGADWS